MTLAEFLDYLASYPRTQELAWNLRDVLQRRGVPVPRLGTGVPAAS
jgi:hypothetical protein